MGWPIRRVFRVFWWLACTVTLCALPVTLWEFRKHGYSPHYQAWFIAGIFVLLTLPISVYAVALHTEYYTRPALQKHVIRILWMPPIYGLDSWLALRFIDARMYLDPVRECYEAYVIYSFVAFLMAFLEEEVGDIEGLLERKPQVAHLWPANVVMRPWRMGSEFLWQCKKGVLNYVIARPLVTAIALLTDHWGYYGQGNIDFGRSYVYLTAITNFSQMWALYCLIMFYVATHEQLAPIRPLSKFLCIKAIVFLTFWQSVAIALLVWVGAIRADASWTTYTTDEDFLICIEMFVAALAHAYAFPPRDYMLLSTGARPGFLVNLKHMFDLRDVVVDVSDVVEDQVAQSKQGLNKAVNHLSRTPHHIVSLLTHGKLHAEGSQYSVLSSRDASDQEAGPSGLGASGDGNEPADPTAAFRGPGPSPGRALPASLRSGASRGGVLREEEEMVDRPTAPLLDAGRGANDGSGAAGGSRRSSSSGEGGRRPAGSAERSRTRRPV